METLGIGRTTWTVLPMRLNTIIEERSQSGTTHVHAVFPGLPSTLSDGQRLAENAMLSPTHSFHIDLATLKKPAFDATRPS